MNKHRIKVGMLRSSGKPASRALAMSYVGQHAGVEIYFFSTMDVDTKNKKIKAKKLINNSWTEEVIDYPLIIDNDNTTSMLDKITFKDLSENSYLTTQVLGGKLKTLGLLKDDNILDQYLIPQIVISSKDDFINFINLNNYCVLKPVRGSQGRNIYFINSDNNGVSVNFEGKTIEIENLDDFYNNVIKGKNFIIQKYIKSITINGAPFDIRVHIQRNGSNNWVNTKTYVRVGTGSEMTANIATGGGIADAISFIKNRYKENAQKVLKNLNQITSELPKIFQKFYEKDIDALGIDLGADEHGNLWIFEINSFPGTKFFELEEAVIRINYLKYLYEREALRKKSLAEFIDSKDLWQSNLIIDSALQNYKNNIAILRSSKSKVGLSENFIQENINKINYIICDDASIARKFPEDKVIILDDKESEIISACMFKRKKNDPLVYTVIGSVGKTSVMALLGRSLSRMQPETYINDYGNTPFYIAKGILLAPNNSKNWVFEVAGASNFRSEPISVHSHKMLQPNVCIFTNIAEAHVGEIGSIKDIAIMKSKALKNIQDNSILILNNNIPYQELIRSNVNSSAKIYTYGESEESDFKLLESKDNILKFNFKDSVYEINIPSDLPIEIKLNFLAVSAAFILTQKNWKECCEYFSEWKPIKGRGNIEIKKIKNKNITIINDSYNANPTSLKMAVSSLNKKQHSGRKIAVLGEIAELGEHNSRIHKDLLLFTESLELDEIILIGNSYRQHSENYANYTFFENISEFKDGFDDLIIDNDLILFKGSNSSMLYDFLNKI